MSRLIDADELTAQIMCMAMDKAFVYGNDAIKRSKEIFALAMIAQAPTVDAEPVTRCKDCKYNDAQQWVACTLIPQMFGKNADNNFCSYAEPKETT